MERDYKKYGTNFLETEMVLAVTVEDYDHVWLLINELKPNEKVQFISELEQLVSMIRRT